VLSRGVSKVCTQGLHATITIASARGRSGTTTVAPATALLLAQVATELVAAERDTTAVRFGL